MLSHVKLAARRAEPLEVGCAQLWTP